MQQALPPQRTTRRWAARATVPVSFPDRLTAKSRLLRLPGYEPVDWSWLRPVHHRNVFCP